MCWATTTYRVMRRRGGEYIVRMKLGGRGKIDITWTRYAMDVAEARFALFARRFFGVHSIYLCMNSFRFFNLCLYLFVNQY